MYVTHAPCRGCARLIVVAGLGRVVFGRPYRSVGGIGLLVDGDVVVEWHGGALTQR
jgi:deoxycytidylate deaminase